MSVYVSFRANWTKQKIMHVRDFFFTLVQRCWLQCVHLFVIFAFHLCSNCSDYNLPGFCLRWDRVWRGWGGVRAGFTLVLIRLVRVVRAAAITVGVFFFFFFLVTSDWNWIGSGFIGWFLLERFFLETWTLAPANFFWTAKSGLVFVDFQNQDHPLLDFFCLKRSWSRWSGLDSFFL